MRPLVLVVSFPAQGHINPTLQMAKLLGRCGVDVTFVTTTEAYNRLSSSTTNINEVSFATISDGTESNPALDLGDVRYPMHLERHGMPSLLALVHSFTDSGRPVSCIVYNFLIPWVAGVAASLGVPSAMLWIQPASVLAIYYHYVVKSRHLFDRLSQKIQLPGLPPLAAEDLPSFVLPDTPHTNFVPIISDMFRAVEESKSKWVLVNSFEALEESVLASLKETMNVIGVGPLIPSAVLDKNKSSNDTAIGRDLQSPTSGYKNTSGGDIIHWLDSKPAGSVIYVSFGSMAVLSSAQIDEIAAGLSESGHYFIWVVRPPANSGGFPNGFDEAMKERGVVVKWCSQVEVLAHRSVGCFVTHSGWNSTIEGLANGKPMVCAPQWSDQPTNAMLVEHVWGIGVRARRNQEGVMSREELKMCVSLVMGKESGKEMREKALRWRDLAIEAANGGGLSDRNIRAFVADLKLANEEEKSLEQECAVARVELMAA